MQKVAAGLKDLAFWIQDNAAFLADFTKHLAALVQKVWGLVGALEAMGTAAMANPIGLIAASVAAAGAIIYSQWQKLENSYRDLDATYQKWLTSQITGAKTGRTWRRLPTRWRRPSPWGQSRPSSTPRRLT